jgi:hypothetical protein
MLTKEEADRLLDACSVIVEKSTPCNCIISFNKLQRTIWELTEKPKRKLEIGEIYLNDAGEICKIEAFYVDNELNTLAKIQGAKSGGYLVSGKESFRYAHRLILDKRYKLVEITDGE